MDGKLTKLSEKNFLWQNFIPYIICISATFTGFMKWIQIEIPFVGTFNGSYHIWSLISLLKNVEDWTGEDRIATVRLIVSIPMILWIVGGVLAVVSILIGICVKRKKVSGILSIVSSVFMLSSGSVYLFLVHWAKAKINEQMQDAFGIAIGGGVIKVPVWPGLMVFLGISGIVCSVLFLIIGMGTDEKEQEVSKNMDPMRNKKSQSSILVNNQHQRSIASKKIGSQGDAHQTQKLNSEMQASQGYGFIVFQDMKDTSKLYGANLENSVVVGRDPDGCNIIISGDRSVSRKHCRVFRNGMMCYVEDLQSYNHTYVNEILVSAPVPVKKGDYLRLGNLDLVVAECSMTGSL